MHATPRPLKFLTMLTILLAATLLSQLSPLHSRCDKAEDFVLYSIDGYTDEHIRNIERIVSGK